MKHIRVLEIGKSTAGIGTYLRWLAQGLDIDRFAPTFVCLSENGAELANELSSQKNIRTVSWPMNRFKVDIVSDIILTLRIARLIHMEKFDLIHAHGSKAGFLARVAAIGSNIPVIYSPHCFSFHFGVNPFVASFFAALERFAARFLTARIITVADGEQVLANQYRVGSPKLFVTIHSGIDPLLYNRSLDKASKRLSLNLQHDSLLVGAVGRLGKQKAPLDFVRMAALVHAQSPQTQFIWAGSGPLEEDAKKLCEALGIKEVCHFVGEQNDIPSLLGILDCFVLSSLWEGFPIVLLEAMAMKVPIVATDIPGNNEAVFSGENGWLVSPNDPEAMAEKVLSLLADRNQAEKFVAYGYERIVQEFTNAKMIASIQNTYQDVLAGKNN